MAENDTVKVVFQNLTPGTLYNATAYTTVKNVSSEPSDAQVVLGKLIMFN